MFLSLIALLLIALALMLLILPIAMLTGRILARSTGPPEGAMSVFAPQEAHGRITRNGARGSPNRLYAKAKTTKTICTGLGAGGIPV